MKKKLPAVKKYYYLLVLGFQFLPFLKIIAQGGDTSESDGCGEGGGILSNPLASCTFAELVQSISELAIAIGIPIAAIFIIYSGLRLVMARGDEKALSEAKKSLLWAIIGTAILLGAWVITEVLQSTVETL